MGTFHVFQVIQMVPNCTKCHKYFILSIKYSCNSFLECEIMDLAESNG